MREKKKISDGECVWHLSHEVSAHCSTEADVSSARGVTSDSKAGIRTPRHTKKKPASSKAGLGRGVNIPLNQINRVEKT